MVEEYLVVEFGIEKTIEKDYGYEEKFLMYKNEKIPYKAILKDGRFVAIVSRRYRLLENERVIEKAKEIAKKFNTDITVKDEFPRVYIFIPLDDIEIQISNSVDGSLAFRLDAIVKIQGKRFFIRDEVVRNLYKKHVTDYKNILNCLEDMIQEILKHKDQLKQTILELKKVKIEEFDNCLDKVLSAFPKKIQSKVREKASLGTIETLFDLYQEVTINIWNLDCSMKRKIKLFQKLNRVVYKMIALR